MITTAVRDDCVEAAVFGRLTLDDFRQFEAAVDSLLAEQTALRAFVDLRAMEGLTLDAVIEDFRFARRLGNVAGRIAVLTEDEADSFGAWLEQSLVDAEIRLFDAEPDARAWLAGELELPTP